MAQEPSIRVMRSADLDAIVAIDQKAAGQNRRDYFERKLNVSGTARNWITVTRLLDLAERFEEP